MNWKQHYTKKEDDLIKQYYRLKDGKEQLIKLLSSRTWTGIAYHARQKLRLKGRRDIAYYTKNENFFSKINLQNSTIAGFIGADGNIHIPKSSRGQTEIKIELGIEDIEYLKKIKEITNYDAPVYTRKRLKKGKILYYCSLTTAKGNKWAEDLNKNWDLTPCKSATLEPPLLLNTLELKLAYITGLIDGDGGISIDNGQVIIELTNTKSVLQWVKDIYDEITPYNNKSNIHKCTDSDKVDRYTVSGARLYVLAKIFFCLDLLRMERKWSIVKHYVDKIEARQIKDQMVYKIRKLITKEQIEFLAKYGQKFPDFLL